MCHNNFDLDKHDLFLSIYEFVSIDLNVNQLIIDEYNYNINNLKVIIKQDIIYLNSNQKIAFNALCQAITSSERGVFFLEIFDDIDKTFLINLMLAKIQFENHIALSTIFFDIVTILLNSDIIAHSHFKISIDI